MNCFTFTVVMECIIAHDKAQTTLNSKEKAMTQIVTVRVRISPCMTGNIFGCDEFQSTYGFSYYCVQL